MPEKLKQYKGYLGAQSGLVTCLNDAFGKSLAVFQSPYRPGDIATRRAMHVSQTEMTESHFRIVRGVTDEEIESLMILCKTKVEASEGWWYEVIGD